MSYFSVSVAASYDDAEQNPLTPFEMIMTSSDLELDGADGLVGMRFLNVTIPQGATIDSAKIQFAVKEVETEGSVICIFDGEDIDDAPQFADVAENISDRTGTTATATWDVPMWENVDDAGAAQLSTELKTIVQEIVNRPGWESGNALVIMIRDWNAQDTERIPYSWNGTGAAPEIQITYTDSVAYDIVVTVGTFALTGIASSLLKGFLLTASLGTFALTGIASLFNLGFGFGVSVASFILTGTSTTILKDSKLSFAVGTFALTGIATNLLKDSLLSLVTGSINLTGKAVTLLKQSKFSIVSQSFSLTGFTSNFYYGVGTLIAAVSSFLLTGKDILLSIIKNDPGYNPLICFKRESHKMERCEPIERKDPE
ncbi:MAG: hypothetical protein WBG58_09120, partial [Ignavibacteriaceae bacterium]